MRPDILVIQEFDRDAEGRALDAFTALLAEGVADLDGLLYPHRHQGRVNAGEPSGLDLDGDGTVMSANDAWGYGLFPGHDGMAVLSRLPIGEVRSYRLFRWSAMPEARRPHHPDGRAFHPDDVWRALRLSSRAHWILPVTLPGGKVLNLLAAYPTPPVFDGPEDRNGKRNADEIRLLTAMIDGAEWLTDDQGRSGGLAPDDPFVVAGDLNADPRDGEAVRAPITALLAHPRLYDPAPTSPGALEASLRDGGLNEEHETPPATDTADWRDSGRYGSGNMRVDYVLPSTGLEITGSGVFWPVADDPLAALIRPGEAPATSIHRMVWIDIAAGD